MPGSVGMAQGDWMFDRVSHFSMDDLPPVQFVFADRGVVSWRGGAGLHCGCLIDVLLSVVGVPCESSFLVVVLNAFIAAAHMPFLFPGSALLLLSHAWDAIPIPLCHAAWTASVIFAGSYPLGFVAFFLYCPFSSLGDPAVSGEK